jgi:hypothetical protein
VKVKQNTMRLRGGQGRLVPVADCIAATEAGMGMWCHGERGGGKRYRVWGAVKEV